MNTSTQNENGGIVNKDTLEELVERGRRLHAAAVQQVLIRAARQICALFARSSGSLKKDGQGTDQGLEGRVHP